MASRAPPPTPRRPERKRPLATGGGREGGAPLAPMVQELVRLYPREDKGTPSKHNESMGVTPEMLIWLESVLRTFDPREGKLIGQGDSGSQVYSIQNKSGAQASAMGMKSHGWPTELAVKYFSRDAPSIKSELGAWSVIDSKCRSRHILPLIAAHKRGIASPLTDKARGMESSSVMLTAPKCEASLASVIDLLRRQQSAPRLGKSLAMDQWKFALLAVLPDMIDALSCVEDAGYYHRDVKPDNIYYCNGQWNLGDFGVAISFDDYKRIEPSDFEQLLAGSGAYQPPRHRSSGNGHYTGWREVQLPSDIYALGVTMSKVIPLITDDLLAPDARAAMNRLVAAMMSEDATRRPTLAQLREIVLV